MRWNDGRQKEKGVVIETGLWGAFWHASTGGPNKNPALFAERGFRR